MTSNKDPNDFFYSIATLFLLAFSLLSFIYLAFIAQMIVVQDAISFEYSAKVLHNSGWIEFFKTGLHREPFYIILISQSMGLADLLHVPYQDVLKFIQIGFLFATQLLAYYLLRKLSVQRYLTLLIVFLIGFLPSFLDSAFNLYSEIATYPFILALVISTSDLLSRIKLASGQWDSEQTIKFLLLSFSTSILFVIITLTKAPFEYCGILYILFFGILFLKSLQKKEHSRSFLLLSFILIFAFTFLPSVNCYKSLNKKHNGNYAITNRGPFMFYGNTSRHMEPFRWQHVAVGVFCAMGSGEQKVCQMVMGKDNCSFWTFVRSDEHAHQLYQELTQQGYSSADVDKMYVKLAVQMIFKNPFQYILFYIPEVLSIVFFKAAETGFAAYPTWLSQILGFEPFRYTINFLSASLTFLALILLTHFCWKNLKTVFEFSYHEKGPTPILISIFIIVIPLIGLYALTSVQTRYCLPIAPLFLILIAFFINRKIQPKRT